MKLSSLLYRQSFYPFVVITTLYSLRRANPPVAVLSDYLGFDSSSGKIRSPPVFRA